MSCGHSCIMFLKAFKRSHSRFKWFQVIVLVIESWFAGGMQLLGKVFGIICLLAALCCVNVNANDGVHVLAASVASTVKDHGLRNWRGCRTFVQVVVPVCIAGAVVYLARMPTLRRTRISWYDEQHHPRAVAKSKHSAHARRMPSILSRSPEKQHHLSRFWTTS